MRSQHKPATQEEREHFPEYLESINEDPARYLDKALVNAAGNAVRDDMFLARLRGIDRLAVIDAWIDVETRLERGPRQHVLARLNQRKQEIREHGERDLPGRTAEELRALHAEEGDDQEKEPTIWRHVACGSTDVEQESSMAWYCHECEQRTNRVEEVEA